MSNQLEDLFESFSSSLNQSTLPRSLESSFHHLLLENYSKFCEVIESLFLQLSSQFDKNRQTRQGLKFILSIFQSSSSPDLKINLKSSFQSFFNLLIQGCKSFSLTSRHSSAWTLFQSLKTVKKLELFDELQKKLLKTTKNLTTDKNHKIRLVGVKIASSLDLQNELVSMLAWETQKDVKKSLVKKIRLTKKSASLVAKKLKDVDPEVRLIACQALMSDLLCFNKILPLVLNEKNEKVRESVFRVIQKFIEKNRLEGLLSFFNLQKIGFRRQVEVLKGFEYICLNVLSSQELIQTLQDFKSRVKTLNLEELVVLRYSCQALNNREEYQMQVIMNEFLPFLGFIHTDHPLYFSDTFVKICPYSDLGEEQVRSQVIYTLSLLLITFPLTSSNEKSAVLVQRMIEKQNFSEFLPTSQEDVLVETVKTLKKILKDDDEEFQRIIVEVMNEIIDPWLNQDIKTCLSKEKEMLEDRLAMLKSEDIDRKSDVLNEASEKNFINLEVLDLQEKIEKVEKNIENVLLRTCCLLCEALRHIRSTKFFNEISEIFNKVVYTGLKSEDVYIKGKALETFGVFCLKKPAHFHGFMDIFKTTMKESATGYLEMISLRFVIDFLMIFQSENNHFAQAELVNLVYSYTRVKNQNFQIVSIEGLCKLFTTERITRSDILSDLLFIYFLSASPDQAKQFICIFLLNFSQISPKNAKILANSYFLILSRVPTESNTEIDKLASINSFILASLDPEQTRLSESSENLHFYLFFIISQKFLSKTHSSQLISRLILQLKFFTFNDSQSKITSFILQDLKTVTSDKTVLKALDKIDEQVRMSKINVETKEIRGLAEDEKKYLTSLRDEYESLKLEAEDYVNKTAIKTVKKSQKTGSENKENQESRKKTFENDEKTEDLQPLTLKRQRLS